ncbi:hypothetical protein P0082_09630 [Candidatus Haliotispira prima]|uniref:Tetratricopeptide repeat protein n=1 Tax=Candidatus Haliotispira prima TaxID=3034016 RepID=A0ABY8MFG3_9SPIO|nr:hypothetical protein P0082_09630 [Candidatus Haliotispira prima]
MVTRQEMEVGERANRSKGGLGRKSLGFWVLLSILLLSCSGRNAFDGPVRPEEQLLSIEEQNPVAMLREKGLSKSQEQRLKALAKELKVLSKDIQKPLLQRARYANRSQAIALIFMNHGMYREARRYLDKAIEFEGNNATLFYYRALCSGWLMKNSIDGDERIVYQGQAEWDYERSLEIKPDYTDSLYGLSVLKLFEEQDFEEAARLLDRYIAGRNIRKQAAQARGEDPGRRKKARTLREAQRQAKELGNIAGSKDINALFMRARAAYGLERPNEAAGFYEWAGAVAISQEVREHAEQLKNRVLQENEYRADTP